MRKITFCLLSLLCLSLPVSVFAQLEELEHKAVTIGDAAESITPDTQWYLVYNKRESTTAGGGYWWDRGFYNEDDGVGTIYMSEGPDVVYDGLTAKSAAEYLVRFIKVNSPDAPYEEYYVQFGTGNYVWTPSTWNGASADVLVTVATIEEASTLYAYCINDEAGHFGFLTTDGNDWRVDENGSGATVCLWESGEASSSGGNNDFTLYTIELVDVSDWDEAFMDCAHIYSQYLEYSGTFTVGTDPGCYGEEEVAAFEASLVVLGQIDTPDVDVNSFSVEQLNQMAQDVIDAYNAVVASRIPLAMEIAEGYYFFNCGMEFTEETEDYEDPETGEEIPGETVTVVKGMYSEVDTDGTFAKWKTAERSCPFLWKVTAKGDKVYEVMNMATNTTFDEVATSTNVSMADDNGNLMVFDVGTGDMEGLTFIRVSTQAEDDYYYLHCGGHNSGAGVNGYIVGWDMSEASSWILEPVSDEEAEALIEAYAPERDQRELYVEALIMINDAEAKMQIAEDVSLGTEKLITSVDQLSSPYTEESEGSLDALIDEDLSTFWHSNWSDGDVPAGTHYLQVELMEAHEDLVFVFSRRAVTNDHITLWGVYGAPDSSADKDECTQLCDDISTPFSSNSETLTSSVFNAAGFTLLRFYIEDTYGSSVDETRGYGHMSEFQLYDSFTNPTSQKVAMGEIYTNLEEAIAAANAEGEYISSVTFAELQAAYDAFIAVYVDPSELREVLAEATTAVDGVVIGENPGYWSDGTTGSALDGTVSEATTYDKAGVYTQSQSDTYVETLQEQMAALSAAAIKVQTGKWYEIRYATEAEMEENGWSLSNGESTDTQPELYGKYVAVATLVEEDGVYTIDPLQEMDLDIITVGHNIYFIAQDEISYKDYAKFRFINVGDTAYMMQNKATGLFLKAAGTSGGVTLSVHPTLFNVSALGYGQNLIAGATLDGDTQNNLHAQRDYNQLVTWETATAGSNSGLYIEDIGEEVESDYDGTEFNMSISYGALNTFCYPVSIAAIDEGTLYVATVEGTTITLNPLEGNIAAAGQPFVFVIGELEDYEADAEAEVVAFTHGYDIEKEAQTLGQFVGSYYSATIGSGNLLASGNEFTLSKSSSSVSANGAYVSGEFTDEDDITIVVSEQVYDGVESAVVKVAQDGNIYSIDGKYLGKGNLNSLKTLGKGIYIINGVKVAVK